MYVMVKRDHYYQDFISFCTTNKLPNGGEKDVTSY